MWYCSKSCQNGSLHFKMVRDFNFLEAFFEEVKFHTFSELFKQQYETTTYLYPS